MKEKTLYESHSAINASGIASHAALTKAGIARARANGTVWGMAGAQNRSNADNYAMHLRPIIFEIAKDGKVFGLRNSIKGIELADELNRRKVKTMRGKKWYPSTVRRLIIRLGPEFRADVKAHFKERKSDWDEEMLGALSPQKKN